ncbi:MAG: PIN domain-containing protein [Trueperaceae bacterium]|nr:MAG: PIN domain-containing protein [Trueperaceae bacterium]
MSLFVDSSVWYAAADRGDRSHDRAKSILSKGERLVTSDHVLIETWLLLRHRIHQRAAERFWAGLRAGVARIETVSSADLEVAFALGETFSDQDFSIVDRTCFALMQRLGIYRVASFDNDFGIFRFGRDLRRAFDVVR